MTAGAVLELAGVTRGFDDGGRRREVLRGVDLAVEAGELVALVGPSGAGKTTLLTIMGALDADFGGSARLLGQDLKALRDDARAELRSAHLGFVFQSFHLLEHLSVIANVEVPAWLLPAGGPRGDDVRAAALAALARVGLADRADASVRALSGGERQRVAVARALMNRPRLLLADEPTGNLDAATGAMILDLFDALRRGDGGAPPCAVIVATHDPALAARAGRRLALVDGRLAPAEAA